MLFFHFLRLVRFGNLMVIGVTMCIIQSFISTHNNYVSQIISDEGYTLTNLETYCGPQPRWLYDADYLGLNANFLFLTLSVILIAAAGNIINDYFDVKADRVNKPEKMVIGKFIKRRWAIMWNWILNAIGFGIAAYLSWKYENSWIALIAFATINFLWFYSALYKRKIFVGNIIIAALVGIVPIYVLIYNLPLNGFETKVYSLPINFGSFFVVKVVVIISTIAFLVNLMREIIKDIADIRGDLHLEAKTVPIALGIRRTKMILTLILIPLLALMAFYLFDVNHIGDSFIGSKQKGFDTTKAAVIFENIKWFNYFVIAAMAMCLISFVVLLTSNNRKKYLLASNVLKLAMLFGMVSPLFL